MKKFLQPGAVQEFTAPGGGVVVDVPVLIGGIVVVPEVTAAVGVRFNGAVEGVFLLPKTAGVAWTEGQVLYFDSATSSFATVQSATARRAGAANAAALAGDVTGKVFLLNIGAVVNVA
jgi:predicted RecA/RadA family phage recombinase